MKRIVLLLLILFTAGSPAAAELPELDNQNRQAVIDYYHEFFCPGDNVEPGWSGDIAAGNPGQVSADYVQATLARINFFRAFAGAPSGVVFNEDLNALCRQAALILSANDVLTNFPSESLLHFSADGALALENSLINLGASGPEAVYRLLTADRINDSAAADRRFLLFPPATEMGLGAVHPSKNFSPANALWVVQSNPDNSVDRSGGVPWPPAGFVPHPLNFARWTFSLPDANFSSATVEMQRNGVPIEVELETVANVAGDNTLVWTFSDLQRGQAGADIEYQVTVRNVLVGGDAREFTYSVTQIDPEAGIASKKLTVTPGEFDSSSGTHFLDAVLRSESGCIRRGDPVFQLLFASEKNGDFEEFGRSTANPVSFGLSSKGFYLVRVLGTPLTSQLFEFVPGKGIKGSSGSGGGGGKKKKKKKKKKRKQKKKNKKKK